MTTDLKYTREVIGTRPQEFPGTTEERNANHNTHCFLYPENRCMNCD